MKTIVDRLKEQNQRSADFEKRSFGMPIGDGFTDMVREITGDKDLARRMAMEMLLRAFTLPDRKDGEDLEDLSANPAVYRVPLQHLFWGIEIGRQMEREQREAEVEAAK